MTLKQLFDSREVLTITVNGNDTYHIDVEIYSTNEDDKTIYKCYVDATYGKYIDMIDTTPEFTNIKQCIKHLKSELKRFRKEVNEDLKGLKIESTIEGY